MDATRRPVPGFPGLEAGSDGSFWYDGRPKGRGRRNAKGYMVVSVPHAGRKYAHRLVLLAFSGKPKRGHEGSHLNGIKDDNRIENLVWESHCRNMLREIGKPRPRGADRKPREEQHKPDVDGALALKVHRLYRSGIPNRTIAAVTGLSCAVLVDVLKGRINKPEAAAMKALERAGRALRRPEPTLEAPDPYEAPM